MLASAGLVVCSLSVFSGQTSLLRQATLAPTTEERVDDGLDHEAFRSLHRELVPTAEATFESIPWHIDLEAARAEAAESGCLIFLWSMNGHPLGCT